MENIVEYFKEHWQYVVIAGGILTLLGAIFNWKWITSLEGEKPFGPDDLYMIRSGRAVIVSLLGFSEL